MAQLPERNANPEGVEHTGSSRRSLVLELPHLAAAKEKIVLYGARY